jgi:hypothetical protein
MNQNETNNDNSKKRKLSDTNIEIQITNSAYHQSLYKKTNHFDKNDIRHYFQVFPSKRQKLSFQTKNFVNPNTIHTNSVISNRLDTNVLDTNVLDTNVLDTNVLDTNVLDTNVLDTNVLDTTVLNHNRIQNNSTKQKNEIDKTWLSPTSTKNYFLKDQFLDYMKYHSTEFIKNNPTLSHLVPSKGSNTDKNTIRYPTEDPIIVKMGKDFEQRVYNHILAIYPIHEIADLRSLDGAWSSNRYQQTLNAIKDGKQVILSAVIHLKKEKLYGELDLLVRSDCIHLLFPKTHNPQRHASKFSNRWHYQVVDIKYRTLILFADGNSIRNNPLIRGYKSQLYLYTKMLAEHQEYDPKCAYILGRGWSYTKLGIKYSSQNCMEKLGIIHFDKKIKNNDAYIIKETDQALENLRDIIQNGHTWKICPDTIHLHSNLRPNMKNVYDMGYRPLKHYLAETSADPTLLYYCNVDNRLHAEKHSVYRFDDKKCTPEILGKKSHRKDYKILSKMLQLLHNKKKFIYPDHLHDKNFIKLFSTIKTNNIKPNNIKTNNIKKKNKNSTTSNKKRIYYVDFETNSPVIDSFDQFPYANKDTYIVMIGIGWFEDTEWKYKHFTVDQINMTEEHRICTEFSMFVHQVTKEDHSTQQTITENNQQTENTDFVLVHWSSAESKLWSKMFERHYEMIDNDENEWYENVSDRWYDLLKLFKSEPIIIKKSYNFSIKTISKQMSEYGMIQHCYSDSIQNGLDAANLFTHMDQKAKQNNSSICHQIGMQDLIRYNEMDCRVMAEIIIYLLQHYSK